MKVNVCIVTFPLSEAGYIPLSNLVKLLSGLANRVYVVSGGAALETLENSRPDVKVQTMKIAHRVRTNLFLRIVNYVLTQLKILGCVIVASRDSDLFVFSIGGEDLVLSVLTLKLLRKKIILMPGGVATKGYSVRKDPLAKSLSLLISITTSFADRLVLYSQRLIQEGQFQRYRSKIVISHRHFVDFSKFNITTKVADRSSNVGYIGRLSAEKGVVELASAMILVMKERKDVHFMLCGEGDLFNDIQSLLKDEGVESRVILKGWVPHDDIPRCLNELRLVILPSITEGLPNILLEAMACGTPLLTTSVGAISDIVTEGKTGFLLESTNPQHIAERILELLAHPSLIEQVSEDAYAYVKKNFMYERTLSRWRGIFNELCDHTAD